jgi:hypothetical protein
MRGLVVASAGFAMFVTPAAADYQDDMREMRELVLKLQDQVESQQQQIDVQQGVIREAGIEDERGSASALSSFLESTDFSGWVAASYFYNVHSPNEPNAGGNFVFSNPFHQDHNSFQFDEAWFVVDRAATEEVPAGFHFEITYGATASAIQSGNANFGGNDLWIPSANVSYLTPWGMQVTGGKFGTTIGYEVAGAPNNVNITRGFTYNLLQPISHVGVTVSQTFDWGGRYTFGGVNGFAEDQPDPNESKGFLWQLGWGNDTATVLFNGLYEDDIAGPGDDRFVLDLVGELTPTDNLLFWLNVDYLQTAAGSSQGGDDPNGVGVSVGGRVGITDDLGIGARGEFADFDDDGNSSFFDGQLWSATGTVDYALTDNLTWKVEAKYETGENGLGNSYRNGDSGTEDETVFLGTQLYYAF